MFGDREGIGGSKDGPKAGFNALPRVNLRSVYRLVLDAADRLLFDTVAGALPAATKNRRACPHRYYAGNDLIDNPLTVDQWFTSIRQGDAGAAWPPGLDLDFGGTGPRGPDYDRLSPPRGYPAHEHPGRTSAWFTYAMGRLNATAQRQQIVIEYRDVQRFGYPDREVLTFAQLVAVAAKAATFAGIANVPTDD